MASIEVLTLQCSGIINERMLIKYLADSKYSINVSNQVNIFVLIMIILLIMIPGTFGIAKRREVNRKIFSY